MPSPAGKEFHQPGLRTEQHGKPEVSMVVVPVTFTDNTTRVKQSS